MLLNHNLYPDARPEVSEAVKIQVVVLWIVKPCSVVIGYKRFRRPYGFHL